MHPAEASTPGGGATTRGGGGANTRGGGANTDKSGLQGLRGALRANMIHAHYNQATGSTVTRKCGKHLSVMGQDSGEGCTWLDPYETLFLLEAGQLYLTWRDIKVSIHRAYHGSIAQDTNQYRVYAHLTKAGYKVVTHKTHNDMAKSLNTEQRATDQLKPVLRGWRLEKQREIYGADQDLRACLDQPGPSWLAQVVDEELEKRRTDRVNSNNKTVPVVELADEEEVIHLSDDDVQIINYNERKRQILQSIPNCYKMTKMTLSTPSADLLPPSSCPLKPNYLMEIVRNEKGEAILKQTSIEKPKRNDDIIFVKTIKKSTITPPVKRHWKTGIGKNATIKKRKARDNDNCHQPELPKSPEIEGNLSCSLTEGPLGALWSGKTKPLIQPKQARFTKEVYDNITFKNIIPDLVCDPLQITFDLFAPNTHFKKANPPLPSFHVVVIDSEASIPDEKTLEATHKIYGSKNVPLLLAVAGKQSVAFYSFFKVDLPVDVTMG